MLLTGLGAAEGVGEVASPLQGRQDVVEVGVEPAALLSTATAFCTLHAELTEI
jgi:hypothetical protein